MSAGNSSATPTFRELICEYKLYSYDIINMHYINYVLNQNLYLAMFDDHRESGPQLKRSVASGRS